MPFARVPSALGLNQAFLSGTGETSRLRINYSSLTLRDLHVTRRQEQTIIAVISHANQSATHASFSIHKRAIGTSPKQCSLTRTPVGHCLYYFYQFDCDQRLTIASSNRQPFCRQRSCWCPMTRTMYQHTTNGWRTLHFVMPLPLRGSL